MPHCKTKVNVDKDVIEPSIKKRLQKGGVINRDDDDDDDDKDNGEGNSQFEEIDLSKVPSLS